MITGKMVGTVVFVALVALSVQAQVVPVGELSWVNADLVSPIPPQLGGISTSFEYTNSGDRELGLPAVTDRTGRYVAFVSSWVLDPNDNNGVSDIYVKDRLTGTYTLVSKSLSGNGGYGTSRQPTMSLDGRFICFLSEAPDLVSSDTNGIEDAFVRDMQLGVTHRVSVSSVGSQVIGYPVLRAVISGDGNRVAMVTQGFGLSTVDSAYATDVFRHDLTTRVTELVSISTLGVPGNDHSGALDQFARDPIGISADGNVIAFGSTARNLIPNSGTANSMMLVRDCAQGTIELASVTAQGVAATGGHNFAGLSPDGMFVYWHAAGSNLLGPPVPSYGPGSVVFNRASGVVERTAVGYVSPVLFIRGISFSEDSRHLLFTGGGFFFPEFTPTLYPPLGGPVYAYTMDRLTSRIRCVTVNSVGAAPTDGNALGIACALSGNGRYAFFTSDSHELFPGVPLSPLPQGGRSDWQLYCMDLGRSVDLGEGSRGFSSWPEAGMTGSLEGNSAGLLTLRRSASNSPSWFGYGLANGTLTTPVGNVMGWPLTEVLTTATNGAGTIVMPYVWPSGLPAGTTVVGQWAVTDATSPTGYYLSNALGASAP